ncbi:MAG: glutamine-hydrolyzing GMP synthase, partial [Bacillota bacterium]
MKGNKILVVDFGGQYARMIARRIRDLGVYSEVVSNDLEISKFAEENVKGVIFSGGPASTTAKDAPMIDPEIFKIEKPILGICYGMQLIAKFLPGGQVMPSKKKEFGRAELELLDIEDRLFAAFDYFSVDNRLSVWMSHGDSVVSLPTGFKKLASTDNTPIAAFGSQELKIYGVQFHPEVEHTTGGK